MDELCQRCGDTLHIATERNAGLCVPCIRSERNGKVDFCLWCGQPHPVTGSKVVLTVAHVHDDRPEACSLDNLAALCQLCHNRHDNAARRAGQRQRAEEASGQMTLFVESTPIKTRYLP